MSTQSQQKLLIRGSIGRSLGLLVNVFVTFFTMPLVIHAVGDRWYGVWSVVGTVIGYYGYLDFGLSSAVQTFIARATGSGDENSVDSLVTTSFFLFSLAGVLAFLTSCVVATLAPLFFANGGEAATFRVVMLIMGLSPLIGLPMMAFNGLFTAHLRYDVVTVLDVAKTVLRAVLIVILVRANFTIVTLAVLTVAIDYLFHVIRVVQVKILFGKIFIVLGAFQRKTIPELFVFGAKSLVVQGSEVLRFQLDSFVIATFITLSSVTMYNIGAQLVRYLRRLVGMLVNIMVPVYAQYHVRADWEMMRRIFLFSMKISTAVSMVLCGTVVVFGKPFISVWMGERYQSAFWIAVILGVSSLFQVSFQPAVNLVYGISKHGRYAKVCFYEGVANLVLSLALVKPLGIFGVALGTCVPMVAASIWLVFHALEVLDLKLSAYVSAVGRVIVVGAAAIGATALVGGFLTLDSYPKLFSAAAILSGFQVIAVAWGGFRSSERKSLSSAFGRAVGFSKA